MKALVTLLFLTHTFILFGQSTPNLNPKIQVCVAGKCESGEIHLNDILRTTGVLLIDENKEKIAALSFKMVFSISGHEMTYENSGYNFEPKCKELMTQLKAGDSFQVKSIAYKLPGGQIGHAEDRNYRIIQ